MKKRIVLLSLIIIVVLVFIAVNVYLYKNRNYNYGNAIEVKNEAVKQDHCTDNLCFKKTTLSYLGPTYEIFFGYVENKTSEVYDGDVEFIFDTENGPITLQYSIHAEPFQKHYFEAHFSGKNIRNANDYSVREVN